nr:hypothetical protein [Aliamphritea spongicola]
MKDRIQLIVGLGNPGQQYDQTRHNAGADFVAQLAERQMTLLRPTINFTVCTGKSP